LSKDAALYDEPRHLLREGEEIRDPGTCLSILRAIAHGAAQHNEIAQQAKAASASLGAKLARLEDPFFRFWFRYVCFYQISTRQAWGLVRGPALPLHRRAPAWRLEARAPASPVARAHAS